ncbi:hypothetical protein H6P81_009543 [Aristolochia fimbriata]|uniref:Bifunctional inhibitor/plant lipid transfer protein/seed storage helical domain-containing protein n=1 Tax=Aristolochia fimbriata TaxID=158543 RepID=A0AAV7ELC0_ARIFI|nr:hypothetical protein H6P81_009543 [Aristolochia fimbriata]
MAASNFKGGYCFFLMTFAVVGITLSGAGQYAYADECTGEVKELESKCGRFVGKGGPKLPPSHECCEVVQRSNVPCLCGHINKQVEKFISVEKVAFAAKSCERPLPSGTKCGSLTIP